MKRITSFLAILFISGTIFGQFDFGPQIGYTASNLVFDRSEIENSLKSNLLLGVFFRFGKKVYFQPEVNWLTQGSLIKYPSLSDPTPVEQKITLNTIQIPLSVGWKFVNFKAVNIRIMGGFTANYIMNTVIDTKNGDPGDYLTPDDFSNMQWQWQLGLGVDIWMFAIDVKYFGGINTIMEKDIQVDKENYSVSSKSNLFEVTLGWKIF